jgi:hypothetical protein
MPYQSPAGPLVPTAYYNPELTWSNPTYSVPGPYAVENRGYWARPREQRFFDPVVGEEYVGQVAWSTPTIDLRPDLRGSLGIEPAGGQVFRGAAFGAGAKLHVKIAGIDMVAAGITFQWFYREFADPIDPQYCDIHDGIPPESTSKPVEFTEQFYNGGSAVVMVWAPSGGPVRYWRLEIFGRQFGVGNPTLFFSAAMH